MVDSKPLLKSRFVELGDGFFVKQKTLHVVIIKISKRFTQIFNLG